MAFLVKTGSVALNATTGEQAVTGLGFQPKAIIFYLNDQTADGSAARARWGIGMATATTERAAIANNSEDAADTTDADRYHTNAKCFVLIDASQAVILDGDLVSFDADGFTVDITTTDGVQRILSYQAFGGADLTDAKVHAFTSQTTTGSQGVTGVGFQPDWALFITNISSGAAPAANTAGFLTIGHAASPTLEGVTANNMGNAAATSIEEKSQLTNACIHQTNGGAVFFTADFTSFDTDGFTLNWSTANGTARHIYALCLQGGSYFVGAETQKTSTGTKATTGVGFQPQGLFLSSFNNAASASLVEDVGNSIGSVSSTSARTCIWVGTQDNVDISVTDQDLDTAAVIKMMTEGTPTVNAEADLSSFDSDGFTLNWVTADTTERQFIFTAFGAEGGTTTSTSTSTTSTSTSTTSTSRTTSTSTTSTSTSRTTSTSTTTTVSVTTSTSTSTTSTSTSKTTSTSSSTSTSTTSTSTSQTTSTSTTSTSRTTSTSTSITVSTTTSTSTSTTSTSTSTTSTSTTTSSSTSTSSSSSSSTSTTTTWQYHFSVSDEVEKSQRMGFRVVYK